MQMQFQDNGEYCFRIELNSLKFVLQNNSIGAKYSMRKKTGRLAVLDSNLLRNKLVEKREGRLDIYMFENLIHD